jgi:MFS transporter, OPA family, glycerol-3-phosphate transporter
LNQRYQRWRWTSFGITWLIYAGFYFTRQAFGVAKVQLTADPRIAFKREQLGLVDLTFQITYMVGQFVFGPLGDRFGPRRILLLGMTLSVAAAVATGCSTTLAAFVGFALLQGLGQSTGWTNTSKVMSNWFSVGERGRVVGWWCTHYTVGAAAALALAGWATDWWGSKDIPYWPAACVTTVTASGSPPSAAAALAGGVAAIDWFASPGWPGAYFSTAAVLGAVLILTVIFLRSRPEDLGLLPIEVAQRDAEQSAEAAPADSPQIVVDQPVVAPEGSWDVIYEVLSKPSVWLLALAYFPIKLARYCFYFWGPMYVNESLGTSAYDSAMTTAAMPIGGAVGLIVIGYISDKVFQARRAPATILSILATAAIMFVGLQPIHSYWGMCAFFFFVGAFLFGPDSTISATAAMDFGTKRGAGTATGFINGIGSIGAILGGFLPGKITTEDNWTPIFVVMLVGLIASAVILLPLWRVKPPTS